MITQISGPNTYGVAKDPRRKAQSVRFKERSMIPYKSNYNNDSFNKEYEHQQKRALWSSVAIVAGAVLFTVGYFMLSGLKTVKK